MLSGDRDQQCAALSRLTDRGPAVAAAAPAVARLLDSPHDNVRFMAGQCLGRLGGAGIRELVAALDGASDARRSAICVGLRNPPADAADAAPLLAQAARHEDPEVSRAAIAGLGKLVEVGSPSPDLGGLSADLVPRLVAALDGDITVRLAAVEALQALGPEAIDAAPALIPLLDGDHYALACRSAQALARMGEPGVRTLVLALDGAPQTRRRAIECGLRALPSTDVDALPWLLRASRDTDPITRRAAFTAVANLGPAARKAVPHLFATVTDADLAEHVEGDLRRIDKDAAEAYRCTADILYHQEDRGAFAAWRLTDVSPAARQLALKHVDAADVSDRATKASLTYLHARASRDPEAQIDALVECVGLCPPWQRAQAVQALGGCGPRAERVVPLLARVGQAEDCDLPARVRHWPSYSEVVGTTREAARDALVAIQPERAHLSDVLRDLRSGPAATRVPAARCLGRIGTAEDEDIVTALTAATDDPEPAVRRAAERALSQVRARTLR